jgi:hypothetical protein
MQRAKRGPWVERVFGLVLLVGLVALGIWLVLGSRLKTSNPALGQTVSPVDRGSSRTLRNESHGADSRCLWLALQENGDVIIQGQDLGTSVSRSWGGSEYEWAITIKAADVPAYVRCLGGKADDSVLELVPACFRRDSACVEKHFLEKHGIAVEFWSRVGE